jgi:UMF1 family MFS transporter
VDGVFLVLGGFAGLSIGATQSASRALVGVLAPSTKSGEFFAFWAVSSRVASIFGLVSLGVLQAAFGLHRAILVSALFFLIAFFLLLPVNVERGRAAAAGHEGE